MLILYVDIIFLVVNMSEINTYTIYENINLNLADHAHYEFSKVSGSFVPMHWHDAVEIIYVLEGNLTVKMELISYELSAGDCIIINPDQVHSTISIDGNTSLLLQIPHKELRQICPGTVNKRFICDPFTKARRQMDSLDSLKKLILQIQDSFSLESEFSSLLQASLLLKIVFELYSNFAHSVTATDVNKSEKNRNRLEMIFDYTKNHYNEQIALEDVANLLHFQVNYFCRFFKQNTGMTYLNYLNDYRLSKIYHDLVVTDLPLSQLLEIHGFTNYKVFSRLFKERFQTTPKKIHKDSNMGQTE